MSAEGIGGDAAEAVTPHIGYWDSRGRAWRPWCEVYGEALMSKERPKPPTNKVCADCFALAVAEMENSNADR